MISDAVLITGGDGFGYAGYTAELYHPSSGANCSLHYLPDERLGHTLESSGRLCGGTRTSRSCLQWSSDTGTWEQSLTLDDVYGRYGHVSWTPDPSIGTYLMGGWESEARQTTRLIKQDGSQEPGFPLKHPI